MKLSRIISHALFTPFTVQVVLAYEWLSAGWEKVNAGQFVPNISKTLDHFENGNPHEWYIASILALAKSHPVTFGMLIQWGELLVGIGLVAALVFYTFCQQQSFKSLARFIAGPALLGGAFMNLNFYLAAGWTSPSTGGLNMLMFLVEVILLIAWITYSFLPKERSQLTRS